MSTQPPRKLPRIISRVKSKNDISLLSMHSDQDPDRMLDMPENEALARELSGEKVVIRDGVVVAVQQLDKNPMHPPNQAVPRRVVIETGTVLPEPSTYAENPLPGVADEVESYPCKFCADQVYLTPVGLEKHGRSHHPDRVNELMSYIRNIQEEWSRRERIRSRTRERVQHAKLRHESITSAALRNTSLRQIADLQVGQEISLPENNGPERFEACRICNLLVNSRHPTAMENHLRAHKKNDELRAHLLADYGPDLVNRLTCHECHLVFMDEHKLSAHIDQTHVRKRRFVCKWCGHLCTSMRDLNNHKADVHAMPPTQSRVERLTMMKNNMRIAKERGESQDNYQFQERSNDYICRTSCEVCGLRLVRPSLLIRHMLRVHSRDVFSCTVESSGVPSFKIDVERDTIVWSCCETKFSDRQSFLYHRRTEHLEKIPIAKQEKLQKRSENSRLLDMNNSNMNMALEEATTYPGQIVQTPDGNLEVVLPEHFQGNGEIFVVMVEDDNGEKVSQLAYQPAGTSQGGLVLQDNIDGEPITITEEQYEQLRLQFGDDLGNMQIMCMNSEEIDGTTEYTEQDNMDEDMRQQQQHDEQQQQHLMNVQPELTNEEIFEP